ncbi:MAG: hypothetical protein ABL879_10330 [Devosia sp.]
MTTLRAIPNYQPTGQLFRTSVFAIGLAAFGLPVSAVMMPDAAMACTANNATGELACLVSGSGTTLNTAVNAHVLVQPTSPADITISNGIAVVETGAGSTVDVEINGRGPGATIGSATVINTGGDAVEIDGLDGKITVTTTINTSLAATTGLGDALDVAATTAEIDLDVSSTISATGNGIVVSKASGAVANVDLRGTVAAGNNGVYMITGAAEAKVTTYVGANITAALDGGIRESTTSGKATVSLNSLIGAVGTPITGRGIWVNTNTGVVDIKVGDTGGIVSNGEGIYVASGATLAAEKVDVDISNSVRSLLNDGVRVGGAAGDASVTTRDFGTVRGVNGINVNNSTSGKVTIVAGDTVTGDTAVGILAQSSTGDVKVETLARDELQGSIYDDPDRGLTGGSIQAVGNGIEVGTTSGSTDVDVAAAVVSTGGKGIAVIYSASQVSRNLTKSAHVDTVTGGTINAVGDGINVNSQDIDAFITTGAAVTSTGGQGIVGDTTFGYLAITNNASVTAFGNGLAGTSQNGNVTLQANANVTGGNGGTGNGLLVGGAIAASITVGSNATIAGDGTSADAVIEAHAEEDSTIENNGLVYSNDVTTNAQAAAVAVSVDGTGPGPATWTVTNNGTIYGTLNSTSNTSVIFNNNSPNTWVFTGKSNFDGSNDVVHNNYVDSFTWGVIRTAIDHTASETSQFLGLERLDNNGGDIRMADQLAGLPFYRDRTYTTGNYEVGAGGPGHVIVDAVLGTGGVFDADRFLIGGNATGASYVDVINFNGGHGGLSATAIPIIQVSGSSSASFDLTDGPVDVGLYSYDLVKIEGPGLLAYSDGNGAGASQLANTGLGAADDVTVDPSAIWALQGYADASVYNLAAIPVIAGSVWQRSSDGWIDRSGDLRDYYMSGEPIASTAPGEGLFSGGALGTGLWTRAIGSSASASGSETIDVGGNPVTFDTGYADVLTSVQIGGDVAFNFKQGTGIAGGFVGFISDSVAFNSGDDAQMSGVTAGTYFDWINGDTYVSAMVKADLLGLAFNDTIGGSDGALTTFGGSIEAGKRMQMDGFFVEPVARASFTASAGALEVGDDSVAIAGATFEGKVGGRIGSSFGTDGWNVSPYASGFIGMTSSVGASEIDGLSDTFSASGSGAFIEVGGGLNASKLEMNGVTAFVSGNIKASTSASSVTAKAGLRGAF